MIQPESKILFIRPGVVEEEILTCNELNELDEAFLLERQERILFEYKSQQPFHTQILPPESTVVGLWYRTMTALTAKAVSQTINLHNPLNQIAPEVYQQYQSLSLGIFKADELKNPDSLIRQVCDPSSINTALAPFVRLIYTCAPELSQFLSFFIFSMSNQEDRTDAIQGVCDILIPTYLQAVNRYSMLN